MDRVYKTMLNEDRTQFKRHHEIIHTEPIEVQEVEITINELHEASNG